MENRQTDKQAEVNNEQTIDPIVSSNSIAIITNKLQQLKHREISLFSNHLGP